jgi:hypothetical protein
MFEPSDSAIFLRLGPSPRLAGALAGLHGGALACGLASDLPPAVKGALALLVICSAWRSVRVHGLRRVARSIVLLAFDRHGQWRLVRRDGRVLDASLAPGGFSHPLLVVLVFRVHGGGAAAVTILPDAAPRDALRRLRVRLRCEPAGRS